MRGSLKTLMGREISELENWSPDQSLTKEKNWIETGRNEEK